MVLLFLLLSCHTATIIHLTAAAATTVLPLIPALSVTSNLAPAATGNAVAAGASKNPVPDQACRVGTCSSMLY